MKRLCQIGLALSCAALAAPAIAHADPVSVMSSVYEASFFSAGAEHEQATAHTNASVFSWCRRCSAPDASPFLVNANLNAISSQHDGGFNVVFNGGFAATFGGVMTFPVPAMSSAATPSSNTPTITLPITPVSDDDHHATGGSSSQSTSSASANFGLGAALHNTTNKVNTVAGGVTTTGHAALTKAESVAATPEPATLLLLGVGLMSIAGGTALRRRV